MSYEAVQSLTLFTFRDEKETAAKWVSRGMCNKGKPACLLFFFRLCGLVLDRLVDRRDLGPGFQEVGPLSCENPPC